MGYPWDRKGRGVKQTLCWHYYCDGKPEVTVRYRLAWDSVIEVRVCSACARLGKRGSNEAWR